MMTSSRPRDTGESFSNRRGHTNQLSISDPSHHVTEAIGTLYGDSDDDSTHETRHDNRPLSFIASPYGGEQIQKLYSPQLHPQSLIPIQTDDHALPDDRRKFTRTMSDTIPHTAGTTANRAGAEPGTDPGASSEALKNAQALPARNPSENTRDQSYEPYLSPLQPSSPLSPTLSLRDVQADTQGGSQFPLTNIDNPNDIAQELSNLQALRRMSMDVGNSADPDLIPFQGLSLMAMPSIAPSGEDDEGDISRLLWVPAKVHPELAPDQFRNFLEKRVQSIKRRSGDSLLAPDGLQRDEPNGLSRKKSMLSRQIDSRSAESDPVSGNGPFGNTTNRQLKRGASRTGSLQSTAEVNIDDLVSDPTGIVQRLALDNQRQPDGSERSSLDEDKPILPAPTMGLRRSTRTTYRKGGSLRHGTPFSKRANAARQAQQDADKDVDEVPVVSPSSDFEAPFGHNLQRSQSEPLAPDNFSRPVRAANRRHQMVTVDGSEPSAALAERPVTSTSDSGLSNSSLTDLTSSVQGPSDATPGGSNLALSSVPPAMLQSGVFPQRSSSQTGGSQDGTQAVSPSDTQQASGDGLLHAQNQQPQVQHQPPPRSNRRPSSGKGAHYPPSPDASSPTSADKSSNDNAQHSATPLGSGSTRTDSLTFIPTLPYDDRKTDKKAKDKEEAEGGKSTAWKWFKSDDRERKKREKEREKESGRERERDREREREEQSKKARLKGDRTQPEKAHDGARLDVLQSYDTSKGRESVLIERDGVEGKVYDEKKRDPSSRKISDAKKEKDGFFGSIFGGSRRKESKDVGSSKVKQRIASPEPPPQLLRPDIDFPYTRFPIVEERAIYRMAHIKLANPRRDLRSQVLLSNFMYSYLAKVQAMHPQLNVPTSPHQKRQEEERRRLEQQQQQQQQYLEQQQQQQQGNADQYNFDYHRSASPYGDTTQHANHGHDGTADYANDAQVYEYDHGAHSATERQQHQGRSDTYGDDDTNGSSRGYYDYGHPTDANHGEGEMW